MFPLLQLNCSELPVAVEGLAGIEVLTIFGTRFSWEREYELLENGAGLVVRSYSSSAQLVNLEPPLSAPTGVRAPFRIEWTLVLDDLPFESSDGFHEQIRKEFCDRIFPQYRAEGGACDRETFESQLYYHFIVTIFEWLEHCYQLKIGGWPTTPSGEYTFPEPPPNYRYVFQIPLSEFLMALFYRNMNSPEPEWGMYLRRPSD